MKLSRPQLILAVFIGLAAAVGIFFACRWYFKTLNVYRAELATVKSDLQRVKEKVRNLTVIRERLADYGRRVDEFERLIPKGMKKPQLVRDTYTMLTNTGVDMLSFASQASMPTPGVPGLNQFTVRISARGTYPELLRMFNTIRAWHRLIVIQNFGLNGHPEMNCNFGIVVFFVAEK